MKSIVIHEFTGVVTSGFSRRTTGQYVCLVLIASLMLAFCSHSLAQSPKVPDAGYVYPPAVVIGQANSVTLGGYDWTDDLQWFIDSADVSLSETSLPGNYLMTPPPYWIGPRAGTAALPIPREITGRIEVKPDAVPGFVLWQTANANGAGKAAQFVLTKTPDVLEQRLPDRPQAIPAPPIAVSGRLSRLTEIDRYEFIAEQDGFVTVELMARRLGSNFNGVIEVHDAKGTLLGDLSDTLGQDGTVSFSTIQRAKYTVSIHDADFRGDRSYIYRLVFSTGLKVESITPAYAQRGHVQRMTFAGSSSHQDVLVPFKVVAEVSVPEATQATTITQHVETPGSTIEVPIPLSDVPELVRTSSNTANEVMQLSPPVAVTGHWNSNTRIQRFEWEAGEQTWWNVQVQSRAIGSTLDVALTIFDEQGHELASADDFGSLTDPRLSFMAKSAGRYVVEVRALDPPMGRATDRFRLQLLPELPNFQLTVPQVINLPHNGKTSIEVQVQRFGGFTGAVTIQNSDLPHGVTIEGEAGIPEGKNQAKINLVASADTKVATSTVRFIGTATIDGEERSTVAQSHVTANLAPRIEDDVSTSLTLLAVTMPAPFRVLIVDRERQRDVPRGTTYLADLLIERDEGFKGDLYIAMSAKQSRDRQGIRGPLLKVPQGATQIKYPCFMPEWLATDLTRRIVVHGVGAVPDPDGNLRWLTNAGDARITMIMEGALLKVDLPVPQLRVSAGRQVLVPVQVLRSSQLEHQVIIDLDVPEELQGKFHCEALTLSPSVDTGALNLHIAEDLELVGQWDLVVRGTSFDEQGYPVVSQSTLDVLVTPPSQNPSN